MSDTLIICISSLLGLCLLAGVYVYLSLRRWALETERAQKLQERADRKTQAVSELQEHWSANMAVASEQLYRAIETYNKEHERVASAISAHSERIAIMESALKNAIAQIVQTTQYSEERYKQLLAKNVREPGMRPRG